jgi:hypothetical protein
LKKINKMSRTKAKLAKRVSIAGLAIGVTISLSGCFASPNEPIQGIGSQNEKEASPNESDSISYGQVVGNGAKVKTSDGSYEKISIDKNSEAYKYIGDREYMAKAGWSNDDGAKAQQLAVKYLVNEYVDSKALEGGDKAYQEWYKNTAKKYYVLDVYQSIKTGDSNVILGNFRGAISIPDLIHDGKPRQKNVDLSIEGVVPFENETAKGIEVVVNYSVDYRVDDESAAEFASFYSGMSKERLLASDNVNEELLDNKGENVYVVKGQASIITGKQKDGSMKIIGFEAQSDFNTDDFVKQS